MLRSILRAELTRKCMCLKDSNVFKTSANCKFRKYSSYLGAPAYNPDEKIEYTVSKDPEEWKYVARLLPPKIIPEPIKKDSYPSGWKMQDPSALNLPYFVRRTKNHMIPVYLNITFRGTRKLTVIRHILGDIWMFEKDLKCHLKGRTGEDIATRVDEVGGKIILKGDHVNIVLEWLKKLGL